MEEEIWRDIEEFKGFYLVSNLGNIKRIERRVYCYRGGSRLVRERLLKNGKDKNGYCLAGLSKYGKTYTRKVGRLVALSFVPNPDNKPQVNHINAIKGDNRAINLEWVTGSENIRHAFSTGVKSGIKTRGENHHNHKLTTSQVYEIRSEYSLGTITQEKLGKRYGVNRSQIGSIVRYTSWKI